MTVNEVNIRSLTGLLAVLDPESPFAVAVKRRLGDLLAGRSR